MSIIYCVKFFTLYHMPPQKVIFPLKIFFYLFLIFLTYYDNECIIKMFTKINIKKEKNMKRKILASLLAIVAAFACIAFAACDNGDKNNYSETYEGTLSTESYSSATYAAQAFVANEIDSDSSHATFQSYTKTADLTEDEIAKLNLTEEQIADVKTAEKGTIYYTKSTPSASLLSSAPADSGLKSQTIYIVEFNTPAAGGSIKYLAPLPQSGEAVTKSYLESVFNPEYYKNCTNTYEMPITIKMSQGGMSMTLEMSVKYTIRLTETAAEMVVTIKMPVVTNYGITYETRTVTSYLVDSQSGIKQATYYNGSWSVSNYTSESGIEKIADMSVANLPEADYSYFVKTGTGFKMSEEFLNNLMDDLLDEADIDEYLGSGFTHSISAEYYVSEGKLDNAQVVLRMSGVVEGLDTVITIKATNRFANYGTTTVTIPADAKTALGIA